MECSGEFSGDSCVREVNLWPLVQIIRPVSLFFSGEGEGASCTLIKRRYRHSHASVLFNMLSIHARCSIPTLTKLSPLPPYILPPPLPLLGNTEILPLIPRCISIITPTENPQSALNPPMPIYWCRIRVPGNVSLRIMSTLYFLPTCTLYDTLKFQLVN